MTTTEVTPPPAVDKNTPVPRNANKAKKKASRAKRTPAQAAVKKIIAMPLGGLIMFATELVATDRATAEFIVTQIGKALQSAERSD